MKPLEVSCAVRPIYGSLGAKGLMFIPCIIILVEITTVCTDLHHCTALHCTAVVQICA
jgi:hypothetical protein